MYAHMPEARLVVAAFRAAYSEASAARGGAVYSGQSVSGLSDVDADVPLVAALVLCGSDEVVQLGPCERTFLAQSCFKPLTLAMALQLGLGPEVFWKHVRQVLSVIHCVSSLVLPLRRQAQPRRTHLALLLPRSAALW